MLQACNFTSVIITVTCFFYYLINTNSFCNSPTKYVGKESWNTRTPHNKNCCTIEKNRGAQALRALDTSRKVCRGGTR